VHSPNRLFNPSTSPEVSFVVVTLLKNLQLLDPATAAISKVTITIAGERIVDIAASDGGSAHHHKDCQEIDCDGGYALPGLIDLHTHLIWSATTDPVATVDSEGLQLSLLRAADNARKTLAAGITTVRDLGANQDLSIPLASAVAKGYLAGPRIIASGSTLIMTGGHDPFWGIQCDGPAELLKGVRLQIAKGAGVIKISATGGVYGRQHGEDVGTAELSREEIKTVCDEAHRFGLKVAAHAISTAGIWNCIEAGVDTIEHGHFLNEAAMAAMRAKGIVWVPTLYVYRQIAAGENLPLYAVEKARKIISTHRLAFETALTAGVAIACGSDAGSPNTPHGSLPDELATMVEYGSTPLQAIQSATITAARALGLADELGSVAVGKLADLVVLKENPLSDIAQLRSVQCVVKGGVCHFPSP
jgi:imidazolonepropionase-like amidohydrolase